MTIAARLARCERGASAAEFALVLPLLLILLFGVIDVGRFMWEVNQAEKATQVGARMAIVTNPVSTGLVEADFSADTPVGELIPATALGELVCKSTGCDCPTCPTAIGAGVNSAAFTAIVDRMAQIKPGITEANVTVTYRGSGFGFAASPATGGGGSTPAATMDISPLVTVSLIDVEFEPITFLLFSLDIPMPSFTTTLTAEDSAGQYSN